MFTVIFDTNSIYKHPWLATLEQGKELLSLAENGKCRLIIPKVVSDELRRQQVDAAEESYNKAVKGLIAMTEAGIDMSTIKSQLHEIHQRVVRDFDNAFDTLFKKKGVSCEPIPNVSVDKLVQRDMARRRPFEEIEHNRKKKSVGFRDALIWETVLAVLARSKPDDKVFFVTSDHGFLTEDPKGFHPHLLEDLDEISIDYKRLGNARNIFVALTDLKSEADDIAKTTAVSDELYGLVGESVDMQLVYGGDYDYPDFVKFTVPGLEDPTITDMEQVSELTFEENGTSVTVQSEWIVYLEGAIFKSDWYAEDGDSVHVGEELNKHYFEASSDVPVLAVVELDMSDGEPRVVSVELRDLPEENAAQIVPS